MFRRIWIVLFALGAVLGIGLGVKRLSGVRDHRAQFEKHVAEVCARAAYDVYDKNAAVKKQ